MSARIPATLILLTMACGGSPEKPAEPVGTPVMEVAATTLIKDYEDNEVAADAKYRGKVVQISGPVTAIAKDIQDAPYVTIGGDVRNVRASFAKGTEEPLISLRPGQVVTVVCHIDGLTVLTVMGSRCRIN